MSSDAKNVCFLQKQSLEKKGFLEQKNKKILLKRVSY